MRVSAIGVKIDPVGYDRMRSLVVEKPSIRTKSPSTGDREYVQSWVDGPAKGKLNGLLYFHPNHPWGGNCSVLDPKEDPSMGSRHPLLHKCTT